ncbi:YqhG family protein [Bacillus songklensis]|uniref:YqhG family protein n=1 Tax=Bacillus songklensis TaxID=1069116 RepID=A0ABV8AY59_9BACI
MQQHEIHSFLKRYFTANHCEIVEETPFYLTVQLTIEMDKELMNRPFYWHYLEKTGGIPNPAKLTLITDANFDDSNIRGERIHFGSPRLHQIFASTQKFGAFIRLYENVHQTKPAQMPLHPWVGMNVKISYHCNLKKDIMMSLGLHLITGSIVLSFQEKLEQQELSARIPDYCFTLSPLIKPKSGLNRLKQFIRGEIEQDNDEWAAEAQKKWNEDLALLNHFYEDMDEKPECYEVEKQALQELYEPKIIVNTINGGLFYLTDQTTKQLTSA